VRHPRSKQPPSHGQQLAHGASISPEQVIRMLNNHHPAGAAAPGKHVPRAHDPLPPVNLMNNMPVRTVSMSRSADSPHGFGICVKGGRESGLLMLFTRQFFIADHIVSLSVNSNMNDIDISPHCFEKLELEINKIMN